MQTKNGKLSTQSSYAQNIPTATSVTGKTTLIRRTADRETAVPRHHGSRIKEPLETPQTITALSFRGLSETLVSRTVVIPP